MFKQAFLPEKYDKGIVATLPYYEEYFMQIIDIAQTVLHTCHGWTSAVELEKWQI